MDIDDRNRLAIWLVGEIKNGRVGNNFSDFKSKKFNAYHISDFDRITHSLAPLPPDHKNVHFLFKTTHMPILTIYMEFDVLMDAIKYSKENYNEDMMNVFLNKIEKVITDNYQNGGSLRVVIREDNSVDFDLCVV